MHKNTFNAAVRKYKILTADGKSEEEIREAISKDEKQFSEDEVNEIYAALSEPDEPEGPTVYVATQSFRDINNFDTSYPEGQEMPEFNAQRIEQLLSAGLIKKDE